MAFFFQKKKYQKKKFQKILALIDEQEKEETRQLYEELHGYVEVSDINLLKGHAELSFMFMMRYCIGIMSYVMQEVRFSVPFQELLLFYIKHIQWRKCSSVWDPCDLCGMCSMLGNCQNSCLLFGLFHLPGDFSEWLRLAAALGELPGFPVLSFKY